MSVDSSKAVLLLAFGGADSLDNIEPFLKNVLKGRAVSKEMVDRTVERYRLIGGRSPLLDITNAQARAIEEAIKKEGKGNRVYVGMRFWHPSIKDTLVKMKSDGVAEALAIIMAPFTSPVATGGYDADIEDALKAQGGAPHVYHLANWHLNPVFLDIIAGNVREALKGLSKEDSLVIFSSHSLPREALEGDAYEMKVNQAVAEITKRVSIDYKIAYQSQGAGHITWLGPRVEEVITEARKRGKKAVIVVPLGFVADHVETLYDIDIVFKTTAESLGLSFRRTPSLNTDQRFIGMLSGLIKANIDRYHK